MDNRLVCFFSYAQLNVYKHDNNEYFESDVSPTPLSKPPTLLSTFR